MEIKDVEAVVLRNNGKKAVLCPRDGSNTEVTMTRSTESREDFHAMFPAGRVVVLRRISPPTDPELDAKLEQLGEEGSWHEQDFVEELYKKYDN